MYIRNSSNYNPIGERSTHGEYIPSPRRRSPTSSFKKFKTHSLVSNPIRERSTHGEYNPIRDSNGEYNPIRDSNGECNTSSMNSADRAQHTDEGDPGGTATNVVRKYSVGDYVEYNPIRGSNGEYNPIRDSNGSTDNPIRDRSAVDNSEIENMDFEHRGKIVNIIGEKITDILLEIQPYNGSGNYQNCHNNLNTGLRSTPAGSAETNLAKNEILKILISPSSVIAHYPLDTLSYLSLRIVLKQKWKDLIFREVKTFKATDPFLITRQYINNDGFVRTQTFRNMAETYRYNSSVGSNGTGTDWDLNKNNIEVHYKDYFGFTTDRTIRDNDIYFNQEIFFSKKCYSEINLNGKVITADFGPRRGFKSIPPKNKQYICGLVEQGEKGLFYRKWFVCSKEFLKLWTMICEFDHYSLKVNVNGEYKPKPFEDILSELDTSHYDISNNSDISLVDKQKLYKVYNLENAAIHIPDLYQRVAKAVFAPALATDEFELRFKQDLIGWML